MPVVQVTAISVMAKQLGVNRIVQGIKIPHPCGDSSVPPAADLALRRRIVEAALRALSTDVAGPTVFTPEV